MLKIIIYNDKLTGKVLFVLEGSLVFPWTRVLCRNWRSESNLPWVRTCFVNLAEVTFIDESGENLIAELHRTGATFVGEKLLIKAIVEKVKSKAIFDKPIICDEK
jgi:hypothetical protein